jgi:DNA gyrase subunit B
MLEKLTSRFPQYQITPSTVAANLEESMSLEGDVKPVKDMLIFKELKKEWEIPVRFFTSEETVRLVAMYGLVAHLEKDIWTLAVQGKDEGTSDRGILKLCDTIIATAKSLMTVQRYKGLGEMNAEQLWETTLDPAQRHLLQVSIEDALKADQWFASLMGEDVEERRTYIEKHAHFVRNLDI